MVQIRQPQTAAAAVATQIRAGRAVLGWTQDQLAGRSGVAKRTIVDAENALRLPRAATLDRISAVFGEAGIEWVASGGRYGLVLSLPGADGETGMTPSRPLAR